MPGPRVYTIEEVDRLLPKLEKLFARMDAIRVELKAVHIRVTTLEMIWGAKVREPENPDHGELEHHMADMKLRQEEFERCTKQVAKLGGEVKSTEPALVDFYGVREGRLVFWCWTRGETRVEHWHHVDQGFAERQKV
jgi:hypothetical protein